MTYGHEAQNDVAEFHRALDIPIGDTPELRNVERVCGQIAMAAQKVALATDENDLMTALDGLCRVLLTAYSAALEWGVDLKPFWDEVMRAQMAKTKGAPPAEATPDIAGVLRDQIAKASPVPGQGTGNFRSVIGRSATVGLT